ncbi:hypothetical protein DE146DRAFT_636610 [Phaeosphaeria sp. MPI-PUGE-AT-0046c]|nr:hypothetical protein DE146DRAFT_636610 [Phaeosphaeria sp. MPI-PUGE-AT-0046c]
MKLNSYDMFALILCSRLCGIFVAVFNLTTLLTDKEIVLLVTINATVALLFSAMQLFKNDFSKYFSHHQYEIESRQLGDLQEAHRRRILGLKSEHKNDLNPFKGLVHRANARYLRLEGEYDWITTAYQDQMRTTQEQEDRIDYLQSKLQEIGQASPSTRQPYSAPPSQLQFAKPPRRSRGSIAAGAPSPLSQVTGAGEIEDQ